MRAVTNIGWAPGFIFVLFFFLDAGLQDVACHTTGCMQCVEWVVPYSPQQYRQHTQHQYYLCLDSRLVENRMSSQPADM